MHCIVCKNCNKEGSIADFSAPDEVCFYSSFRLSLSHLKPLLSKFQCKPLVFCSHFSLYFIKGHHTYFSLSSLDLIKYFCSFFDICVWLLSSCAAWSGKNPAAQIEFQDLFFLSSFFFRWTGGSSWLQKEHHHGIKVFFGPYLDYNPLTRLWDDFWQLGKSWPPTYIHCIKLLPVYLV